MVKKKEVGSDGTLIIRGTEREIKVLQSSFIGSLNKLFIINQIDKNCDAFLTKGEEFLTIQADGLGKVNYNVCYDLEPPKSLTLI